MQGTRSRQSGRGSGPLSGRCSGCSGRCEELEPAHFTEVLIEGISPSAALYLPVMSWEFREKQFHWTKIPIISFSSWLLRKQKAGYFSQRHLSFLGYQEGSSPEECPSLEPRGQFCTWSTGGGSCTSPVTHLVCVSPACSPERRVWVRLQPGDCLSWQVSTLMIVTI